MEDLTEDEEGIEVAVEVGEEGIVDEGNADEGVGTETMESTRNSKPDEVHARASRCKR